MTTLLTLVVVLVVAGLLLWAVSQLPMDPAILKLVRVVVVNARATPR
jgi:hypothetical protein